MGRTKYHERAAYLGAQVIEACSALRRHHPESKMCADFAQDEWTLKQNLGKNNPKRIAAGSRFALLVRFFGCGLRLENNKVTVYLNTKCGTRDLRESITIECDDHATACRQALVRAWRLWGAVPALVKDFDEIRREQRKKKEAVSA